MTYDVLICFFSVTLTMNRLKYRCIKGLRAVEDALHPTLTLTTSSFLIKNIPS